MKIKPEQLNNTLTNQLNSLYFVFGPELLLVEQSLAQIRKAAKIQGFDDKVSFEVDLLVLHSFCLGVYLLLDFETIVIYCYC